MLDWKVTDTNRDTKKEQRFEQRLDQTHTATYREKWTKLKKYRLAFDSLLLRKNER